MNAQQIEDEVQALLKEAEPMRSLPEDDDIAREPLRQIVDRINFLRAKQGQAKNDEALQALIGGIPAEATPYMQMVFDRASLEAQARAGGVEFRSNISDAKLAERIEESKKSS